MASTQTITEQPETRVSQRATVTLEFWEVGERVHTQNDGWARIDGCWLLWKDDEMERWQSWPMDKVIAVEWHAPEEAAS